jgi:oligoendopeptidase F
MGIIVVRADIRELRKWIVTTQMVLKRKDVLKEQTWNAEILFESLAALQAEFDAISAGLPELTAFAGRLGAGPAVLVDWFDTFATYNRRVSRLFVYLNMATAVDNSDHDAKAKLGQAGGLAGKFGAAIAFAEPEMQALGETLMQWAEEEPRLAIYKHYFDDLLRQKKHTRSAEVEAVLGLLQDPFGNVRQTASELANTDLKFADAVDSEGMVHPVMQAVPPPTGIQSPDRERRRTAWERFSDGYLSMQNTLASNYITSVKQQVFTARVRGYDSVLEARLAPYNVPLSVFHNLIDTFQANLSTWHRYWAVKRKILGVDRLHPYDVWAPIVDNDPVVSYKQAVDWIWAGMAPLGDDYVSVMRRGCLQDRWVDYAPNSGKMQGAFANAAYDSIPYVFTSYNDTLMAMSILAHELGHAMHSYLMDQNQPEIYNGYRGVSSSVAETASNFNQALTRAYLREAKADDTVLQIALIDEALFNFHRYFFQMPTLARFELEVFTRAQQDQPLNADILNGIMRDLFAAGYGDTMSDDPDRTAITWAQFGHLYMPFYTFQYSVGISAAHALADDVLAGVNNAAENYVEFLSAGGSLYSMDLFKLAGVDMSTPEPVEKTFGVLADMVERLEQLAT